MTEFLRDAIQMQLTDAMRKVDDLVRTKFTNNASILCKCERGHVEHGRTI